MRYRRIASLPAEACDETRLHRIHAGAEHNRDCRGRPLRRRGRAHIGRDHHRRPKPHQLGSEGRQAIELSVGEPVLDRNTSANDEAGLLKSFEERRPDGVSASGERLLKYPIIGRPGCDGCDGRTKRSRGGDGDQVAASILGD